MIGDWENFYELPAYATYQSTKKIFISNQIRWTKLERAGYAILAWTKMVNNEFKIYKEFWVNEQKFNNVKTTSTKHKMNESSTTIFY